MTTIILSLMSLVIWFGAWRFAAGYWKKRGRGALFRHALGATVGFVVATVALMMFGASPEKNPAHEAPDVASGPSLPAEKSEPAAAPAQSPEDAKKSDSGSRAAVSPSAAPDHYEHFIGHSFDTLLDGVPQPIAHESERLNDGTRQDTFTINPALRLVTYGNGPDPLRRYVLIFSLDVQDEKVAMLTGVHAMRIFSNTFPGWKDGDGSTNPMRWFIKTMDEFRGKRTKPAEMTRDDLRARYGVIQGKPRLYIISVTPTGEP